MSENEPPPTPTPPPPADDADDWTADGAPDASAAPESVWHDEDIYLGGEAAVSHDSFGGDEPGVSGDRWYSALDETADPDAPMREMARRMETGRTPVYPLDARRRIPMEFVWKRWRALAMRGRSDVVDDFGRDPIATARWEWVLDFLYSRWFRVEATGVEHVPAHGPALLIANHAGSLPYDSAMVMHAVRKDHPARRDVRPLVEDAVFHLPWLGPLMNRIGGVRACPENAERLIAKGEVVAVFPEGVKGMGKLWRDRYRLQRFGRGGFVKLALRTGAPIIPVAVVGSEEALPLLARVTWFAKTVGIPYVPVTPTFPWLGPLGLVPLPSKWRIRFGEPLDVAAEYGPEAADDRLLVGRLSEQVRAQVQAMVDDLR